LKVRLALQIVYEEGMRTQWMGFFVLGVLWGCSGKVDNPTPKGAVLIDWNRASARLHDLADPSKEGPAHPLAGAKVVEGPKTRSFAVTIRDAEQKALKFNVKLEVAKVSWADEGKESERWAPLGIKAELTENEAFDVKGSCDNRVASVLGAPGQVTNAMMSCQIVGKRPNTMGDKDAITLASMFQVEGSGKLLVNDPKATVEENR
jgi:hypothetical protein